MSRAVLRRCAGSLQSQYIGTESRSMLFGQSVVVRRQQATIQHVRELGDPAMMKSVEDAGVNACPIMDWHKACPCRHCNGQAG